MIVYSAIFGGYDVPKPHPAHRGVAEWRLYADKEIAAPGWHVIVVPPLFSPSESAHFVTTPRMRAKWYKCNPPADYAKSLYLDGSVVLMGLGLLEEALAFEGEWASYPHPERDCILEEAEASLVQMPKKYAGQPLAAQAAHYIETGLVRPHGGLWAGGILVRRHTKAVIQCGRDWWMQCGEWQSAQDQIALPYCLARHGIAPVALQSGGGLWGNGGFRFEWGPHHDT
jgi:hypothetical protein